MIVKVFAFFVCVMTRTTIADDTCGQKADVVFIVDTSRSIQEPDYKKQLDFVSDLVTKLNVGPDTTHVGVVSFSTGAKGEIYLQDLNHDIPALQKTIKNIVFTRGRTTDTFDGLELAREKMFSQARGARPDVPRIVIVTTDGNSTNRAKTKHQAQLLRDKDIQVFAVGIGKVNLEELGEIATANTPDYVFKVANFDELRNQGPFIVLQACKAITTTTTTTTTTTSRTSTTTLPTTTLPTTTTTEEPIKVCSSKVADVVFVLDKSGSITSTSFQTQLNFVSDLVTVFNVASNHTHVAVVTFDSSPKIEFGLTDYYSTPQIQKAIKAIEYTAGSTNTDQALELVATHVLTPAGGARKEVAHVVIVVTDGQSASPNRTQQWAREVKKGGAYVFAIGVGSGIDNAELMTIGSTPAKDFVHTVNSYGALQTIKNLLAVKACEVTPGDKFVNCKKSPDAADVMYITDFTHAGGSDVRRNLDLIKNVTGGLGVGEGRVRVGLTSNNCPDVGDIGLEVANSAKDFANAVTLSGSSATPLTNILNRARGKLTVVKEGAREGVKRLAVVFVHGPIGDLKLSSREVLRAKSAANKPGVEFIFVGMGDTVDEKQLQQLSGERNPSTVRMLVDKPGQLQLTWENVLNEICEVLVPLEE
ncbi:collagen alpha-6(VI) chain-like [Pomacea canaliculata]|uniref:collagen alpha-6(VI) chain-like n=1 Tax=Pomacea canaliculata TaxID=400727 RepID=UPI000D7263BD|nr:collagen alpha-6(VI) chain-like [Pomacea canaliculata]